MRTVEDTAQAEDTNVKRKGDKSSGDNKGISWKDYLPGLLGAPTSRSYFQKASTC